MSCEGIGTDVYSTIKIFCANGALYGTHGANCDGQIRGIEWLKAGAVHQNRPDPPEDADWHILELSPAGIAIYNTWMERDPTLERCMAVGSGRKIALMCMLEFKMSPAEAVAYACKYDDYSDSPIYVSSLAEPTPKLWKPKFAKRR